MSLFAQVLVAKRRTAREGLALTPSAARPGARARVWEMRTGVAIIVMEVQAIAIVQALTLSSQAGR